MSKELTAERLRELLHYNPETGVFTWRVAPNGRVPAGSTAGSPTAKGYCGIKVDGRYYLAHRLAWFHTHGRWPKAELDHADGVRFNNAIGNLRECTHMQNTQNLVVKDSNRCGLIGVSWNKRNKAWVAQIQVDGCKHYLGYHDTPEAAHAAYLAAKKQLHTFNPVPRTTTTGTSANDSAFTTTPAARRHRA
jgi:hypothetical protein